jgi:hypothetical protein
MVEGCLSRQQRIAFWLTLVAVTLAVRLAHLRILWVEEAYGLSAALQLWHGATLYGDVWFDKPPLYALFYWPIAPLGPLALRLWDTLFVTACSMSAFRLARTLFPDRPPAPYAAAGLLAFFLSFGPPAMTIALAPDILMVLPHLLAVDSALSRRGTSTGLWAAAAFLVNVKAVFLIPVLWILYPSRQAFAAFAAGLATAFLAMAAAGSWPGYLDAVWNFGVIYARDTFVANPVLEGLRQSAGWLWFHLTLLALAFRPHPWRLWIWLLLSAASTTSGLRFFPRYYFQPLVPLTLLASGSWRRWALILLLIPLLRYGPRHVQLGYDLLTGRPHAFSDASLNQDAQAAARILSKTASSKDTILVWGYRPDLFVHTGLKAGTPWLDSQPLTGVLADRHLVSVHVSAPHLAETNRKHLVQLRPVWIADGLGPLNPSLSIANYSDLSSWLSGYREVARTRTFRIYRRF